VTHEVALARPARRKALGRAGRACQYHECVALAQLARDGERLRVELAQRRAQLIDLPLPRLDHALMRTCEHFDGLSERAVGRPPRGADTPAMVSMPITTSPGAAACSASSACNCVIPAKPFVQPALGELLTMLVEHTHVVVGLGPVIPTKITARPLSVDTPESEKNLSDLKDQCSRHDIPPAICPSRLPAGARSRDRAAILGCCQCSSAGDSTTSLTNPPD
jgi:hypothetical protein